MLTNELLNIAKKARKDFEFNKIPFKFLKKLYSEYNHVEDMNRFLNEARLLFPNLNCGIASVYLNKKIKDSQIVNGKYGKNNHTFLLVNQKVLIDITSDQYGGPKVYVGPIKPPWQL